jgi:branched-chain amino acid transport system substrate-binding protein
MSAMFRRGLIGAVLLIVAISSMASAPAPPVLTVGALFPLTGVQAPLAAQEYRGIQIAAQLVNSQGGVNGRQIALDTRVLNDPGQAQASVNSLAGDHVPLILGTYSSALSIPASQAASNAGITYWEAGAVADQVTGRGLPGVYRVGANGATLGGNSATFAATDLAPRLGKSAAQTRVAVVYENDPYGSSVAQAAIDTAHVRGMPVVSVTPYNAYFPNWAPVLSALRATSPDVIILASYILDGSAFREAMLAADIHVGALIGSTMAECYPDFGNILGPDAVGVFASDRPDGWVKYDLLKGDAKPATDYLYDAWKTQTGSKWPTEEGLAGFTAAWTLFHYVLPHAASFTPAAINSAADQTILPEGSLPNGGGLRFATGGASRGQNLDAIGVIWQWQKPYHEVTVWPPSYAYGPVKLVPLPR